ncbi:MAG: hypothetical protein IIA89_08205 [Chloroflexi bacterium]|nr:hypothetical protein [Chloroflexota bacterium]
MVDKAGSPAKATLIKVAIVGQTASLLLAVLFLAIEDAPDYFKRADLLRVLLAVIAIGALLITRLPQFLARVLPSGLLVFLILLISVSTFLIALSDVVFEFSIPDLFLTPGLEYTRTTSIISFIFFLVSGIINFVLSLRLLVSERTHGATTS